MFAAFAVTGVGGAIKHACSAAVDTPARLALWRVTFYSGGLGSSLLLAALIVLRLPASGHAVALAAVAMEFALFAVWVSNQPDYRGVMLHYLPTGGAVLAVLLFTAWTPSTPWVLAAAAAAGAAGVIQSCNLIPHRRFNHNDLAHALTLPAFWFLFRAGVLIGGAG